MDTLGELFEGSEALFQGLEIHGRWDWTVRHPVVRLDFGPGHFQETGYLHKKRDGATGRRGGAGGA